MTHRSRVRGFKVIGMDHIVIWGKALCDLEPCQFCFHGNNEEGEHVHWTLSGRSIIAASANGRVVVVDFAPPKNASHDIRAAFKKAEDDLNGSNTSAEVEVTVTNNGQEDGQTADPPG